MRTQTLAALVELEKTGSSEGEREQDDGLQMKRITGRQGERAPTVPRTGLALAPPRRRGGVGGPSMHTLAVLRRTNCFSLRQISCKSRLRRQHCPSPPGRRDGRQADGAKGGGAAAGQRVERVYQRRLGAGWRRKERWRRRRRTRGVLP